jgi:hypothetical protein
MSEFKTHLVVELIDDERGLWRLLSPLVYLSDMIGNVVVPTNFETDFASVPRIPVAYFLAGDTARWAAVVHDYLYGEKAYPRAKCDDVFLEAMTASGVPWWRRRIMHAAVRIFGGFVY